MARGGLIVPGMGREEQGLSQMRGRLLATAVMCAGLPAPALAADFGAGAGYVPPSGDTLYQTNSMITGHIQLSFGAVDGVVGHNQTYEFLNVAGRGNLNFGTWNLELEVAGTGFLDGGGYVGFYAHAWRRTGTIAWGGYVGAAAGFDEPLYNFGVEIEANINNAVVGGQLIYGTTDPHDFWVLRTYLDYYLTPNDALTGDLQYLTDSPAGHAWAVTGQYEHRFAGTSFTGFLSAGWINPEHQDDGWLFRIGSRMIFDQPGGTLFGHNMDVPFDLPMLLLPDRAYSAR